MKQPQSRTKSCHGDNRFWMVWNGTSKTYAPKFKHDSLAAACAEAQRLASQIGGKFYVVEAIGYAEAEITVGPASFKETKSID